MGFCDLPLQSIQILGTYRRESCIFYVYVVVGKSGKIRRVAGFPSGDKPIELLENVFSAVPDNELPSTREMMGSNSL